MTYFNKMIETLQNKPVIGIIAGFSSGAFATVRSFLTSSEVISNVTIAGVWLGFIIAILTGLIKIIELIRLVKKRP